jgi:anthranilate phosphoribosyltransferase
MERIYAETALGRGIKLVGIGKHGSKDLPEDLIEEIVREIQSGRAYSLQVGAFFGALLTKGITSTEKSLETKLGFHSLNHPEQVYSEICPDVPQYVKDIGVKLLSGKYLNKNESTQLGAYLFSDEPGEALRGMAASILRIRYETDEEYEGLIEAANATFTEGFQNPVVTGQPWIQLAEPFDGVEHSFLITPILANAFQKWGYGTIVTLGRSGGPKFTLTLEDIYTGLGGHWLKANAALQQPAPPFGWALHQKDLSSALHRWSDRRHQLIKRPFLATMEKVLNPCGANILITSVFHITYMEKMITLAGMTGFEAVIVLKRGLEGTLAPSVVKASGILCGVRQSDGSWLTETFDADEEEFADYRSTQDVIVENVNVHDNVSLIHRYAEKGATGVRDFDTRVNLALALYKKGLNWIQEKRGVNLG